MKVEFSFRISLLLAAGVVLMAAVCASDAAFRSAEGQELSGGASFAGVTYYVDFETGKDENDGRSPSATIPSH